MDSTLEPITIKIRCFKRRNRIVPKILFRSWFDSDEPRTFEIPFCEWESIHAWVHEFCEERIWYLLRDIYNFRKEQLNKNLNIKLYNGKILKTTTCHLITALHTDSIYGGNIINSCDYAKMIFEKSNAFDE